MRLQVVWHHESSSAWKWWVPVGSHKPLNTGRDTGMTNHILYLLKQYLGTAAAVGSTALVEERAADSYCQLWAISSYLC